MYFTIQKNVSRRLSGTFTITMEDKSSSIVKDYDMTNEVIRLNQAGHYEKCQAKKCNGFKSISRKV